MSRTIQKAEKEKEERNFRETVNPNEKKSRNLRNFVHFEKGSQKIRFPVYRDEELGLGELAHQNLIDL